MYARSPARRLCAPLLACAHWALPLVLTALFRTPRASRCGAARVTTVLPPAAAHQQKPAERGAATKTPPARGQPSERFCQKCVGSTGARAVCLNGPPWPHRSPIKGCGPLLFVLPPPPVRVQPNAVPTTPHAALLHPQPTLPVTTWRGSTPCAPHSVLSCRCWMNDIYTP